MQTTYTFASPTVPRLLQTRAVPANAFHQTLTLSPPNAPSVRPIPLPRPICEMSPSTSSPSIYSHAPSQTGHGNRTIHINSRLQALTESSDEEEEKEDPRLSMISGPTLRKYAENPWDEDWPGEQEISGLSSRATRIMRSATRSRTVSPSGSTSTAAISSGSTRRGLSNILSVGKHLLPSASGASLAASQTSSTASSDDRPSPLTPKLKSAFYPPSPSPDDGVKPFTPFTKPKPFTSDDYKLGTPRLPYTDRSLLSSGSPGFGLISLEAAQEREKTRAIDRNQAKTLSHYPASVRTPSASSDNQRTRYIPAIPIDEPVPTRTPARSVSSSHSSPPGTHRIKGKKSSLMKLFNKASSSPSHQVPIVPPLPSPRPQVTRGDSHGSQSARSAKVWADNDPTWPKAALVAVKQLELRPVSMTFTRGLPSDYLSGKEEADVGDGREATLQECIETLESAESDLPIMVREQIANARKVWQIQIYELEAQVRELRLALVERDHVGGHRCACGSARRRAVQEEGTGRVMDRARVKTAGARGVFGTGSLYEWE